MFPEINHAWCILAELWLHIAVKGRMLAQLDTPVCGLSHELRSVTTNSRRQELLLPLLPAVVPSSWLLAWVVLAAVVSVVNDPMSHRPGAEDTWNNM